MMGFRAKTIYSYYDFPYLDAKNNFNWGFIGPIGKDVEVGFEKNKNIFNVDFSDYSLAFKFKTTGLFTTHKPNGPVFVDINDQLAPITGFTLKTNMHGLKKSDIKLYRDAKTGADEIKIDWGGGSFTKDTYVIINFTFAERIFKGKTLLSNDKVTGTKYDDYFQLGLGKDVMTGRGGADTFVFATGESGKTKTSADIITDFKIDDGDVIDLRNWDGNSKLNGVQDFSFIGTKAFSGKLGKLGELRFEKSGSDTYVMGDTDGNKVADFMIKLQGFKATLTADQFLF